MAESKQRKLSRYLTKGPRVPAQGTGHRAERKCRREPRRGADVIPVTPQAFDFLDHSIRNRERVVIGYLR